MNLLLPNNMPNEENEINSIIKEDNLEQMKLKFINHSLDPNHKDRNGITLNEKCAFLFKTMFELFN